MNLKINKNYFSFIGVLVFLVCFSTLNAQSFIKRPVTEIGIGFGVANYVGDLSRPSKPYSIKGVEFKTFRPAASIHYRNNFSSWFAFRAALSIGRLYGHDKFNENFERNLHFRSNVTDFTFMMEWNILPYKIGAHNKKFTPFLGAGLGAFLFNPKAELNGEWVRLQPLGTEGQGLIEYPNRSNYSTIEVSIPVSAGLKWHINDRIGMGLELQYRFIFTDYLDDVSTVYPDLSYYANNYITAVANEAAALSYRQINGDPTTAAGRKRGNSEQNDTYFFAMYTISVRLGQGHVVCPTLK